MSRAISRWSIIRTQFRSLGTQLRVAPSIKFHIQGIQQLDLWPTAQPNRSFATNKSKKKNAKKPSSKSKNSQDCNGMDEQESGVVIDEFDLSPFKKQLTDAVDRFKQDLRTLRTGRANPSLLDSFVISQQGKSALLSSFAQIIVKDTQTLMVVLTDPELLSVCSKQLKESNLGLNPEKQPPNTLMVPIPRFYLPLLLQLQPNNAHKCIFRLT